MKKFITLLLVLTGMVCSASATTIYFKPDANWTTENAWFAVCQKNVSDVDITGSITKLLPVANSDGYYSANISIDEDCAYLKFMRKNPSNSSLNWTDVWNGVKAPNPTGVTLYENKPDATRNDDWSCWDTYNGITVIVPSDMTFTINNFSCDADILPNFMDANSSANNNLISNDDFTYSRTVSGNVIRKGSYGFKLSDGTNTYDDSGSAWAVSGISTTKDAKYNITYSYNFITGVASATATDTEESVSISEKYFLAGDEALTGHAWDWTGDTNVLTIDGGGTTASITLNDVLIKGTYYYKMGKQLLNGGTAYKTFIESGENNNYYFGNKRYYDITFSCNLSTLDGSASASNSRGYYLYGGTSTWDWGQKMTETSTGVYSATLSNKPGYSFCIVNTNEDANLNGDGPTWANVIRPEKTENERTYIGFANYNGTTVKEDSNRGWEIQGNTGYRDANDADVTISYTPASDAWNITCSDDLTIGSAGYATYSNYYKFTVSGADKIYTVTNSEAETVTLTEQYNNTVFAGQTTPIIIKGSGVITINPSNEDAWNLVGANNYLVGSNNGTLDLTKGEGKYIFNWDGSDTSTVGFYLMSENGTLAAHKAYLNLNGGSFAREFLAFDFENETTGIKQVENAKQNTNSYFNLAGQRVAQPAKGLYIVNGKKVIIK